MRLEDAVRGGGRRRRRGREKRRDVFISVCVRMSHWFDMKNQVLHMLDMCTSSVGRKSLRRESCSAQVEKVAADAMDRAEDADAPSSDDDRWDLAEQMGFQKSLDQFIASETCRHVLGLCILAFVAGVFSSELLQGALAGGAGGFCADTGLMGPVQSGFIIAGTVLGVFWIMWRRNGGSSSEVFGRNFSHGRAAADDDINGSGCFKCSKRQFMAYVLNNIRVPFNAIVLGLGHLKAAGDKETTADVQGKMDLVKLMLDCAETMTNVLDDVTDLGQTENGFLELHVEEFDLLAVIKFLVGGLKELLSNKKIYFNMDIEPMVESLLTGCHVLGDKHRVVQTLGFFLSNAVKFTPYGGRLELEVRCEESNGSIKNDRPGSCSQSGSSSETRRQQSFQFYRDMKTSPHDIAKIVISVKDFAAGMASHDQKKLYDLYSSTNRQDLKWEHSGLGLNMAKRFSEGIGGYIGLRTMNGKDNTFCLCIPCPLVQVKKNMEVDAREESIKPACAIQDDSDATSLDAASHGRVLLVEDTAINRIILRKVLENLNLHCEEAVNGQVAVDFFKEGRKYDLVLMDKEMPVMDGHEATRQLRTMGVKTPIVALTGNALQSDKDLFFEAGVDDFLTKPISRDKLVQLLDRFGVKSCANRSKG